MIPLTGGIIFFRPTAKMFSQCSLFSPIKTAKWPDDCGFCVQSLKGGLILKKQLPFVSV